MLLVRELRIFGWVCLSWTSRAVVLRCTCIFLGCRAGVSFTVLQVVSTYFAYFALAAFFPQSLARPAVSNLSLVAQLLGSSSGLWSIPARDPLRPDRAMICLWHSDVKVNLCGWHSLECRNYPRPSFQDPRVSPVSAALVLLIPILVVE